MLHTTPRQILDHAMAHGYIVGAYNVCNLDMLCAVLEAAQKERSAVIVQVSMGARKYLYDFPLFVKTIKLYAQACGVPVALQHDHCLTVEACLEAVNAGILSVMFDGSHLPMEENIEKTRYLADYLHARGGFLEAEIGKLPGFEDMMFAESAELTTPEAAERFVRATGCDALAVSLGTSHGGVRAEKSLPFDFVRAAAIHAVIPQTPLVLHGAASLPQALIDYPNRFGGKVEPLRNCTEEDIRKSAQFGICKANMDVDNFLCFTGAIREVFEKQPEKYDPRVYLKPAREAFRDEVAHKMRSVTCSSGWY